jgi:hypothetical protein
MILIAAKPIYEGCIGRLHNIPRSTRFRALGFPGHCQQHGNRSHKQNSQARFQRVQQPKRTPIGLGWGFCCLFSVFPQT